MRAPSYTMETLFHNKGVWHHLYRTLFITILLLRCSFLSSSAKSEAEILLKFKENLGHKKTLKTWNLKTLPCVKVKSNWKGVLCDNEGKVFGLNLENMGLFGKIDVDALLELPNLRAISVMNNKFNGTFPKLNKMTELKSIYFSGNKFSGKLDPDAFKGMNALKKIHLENNQLSGPIPSSLVALERLVELHLEDNKFSGAIPDFKLGIMKDFNVSNNQLQGPIPPSLSKIKAGAFSGNGKLCGGPLETSCPSPPLPPPKPTQSTLPSQPQTPATPSTPSPAPSSSSGTPVKTIIGIVVGVVLLLILIAIIIAICKRGGKSQADPAPVPLAQTEKRGVPTDLDTMEKGAPPNSGLAKKGENIPKMTFLRDDVVKFELGDLLKASAEVLGSGYFGSSYRAALTTGKMMVVKRFKHMNNVGKEEFQEHMWRIGRLNHPNLLPLVAFYYRKEEKLLVADYIDNVNLAVHLHGNSSRGHPSPKWPTRLKIVKGVAKGLQYLYTELPSLVLPHGHLKSSNVLLSPSLEPLLTDYALIPVVNPEHAQDVMVAYKSPEYKHTGRVSKKTDVWSFGILILEILTGKFPSNFLQQGKGGETDLVTWVESTLQEGQWKASDLLDPEMGEVANESEGQIMKLLKIGMACADADVDKRLDLKEAVNRIEEVKERDDDDEFFSVATTDGDTRFEKS